MTFLIDADFYSLFFLFKLKPSAKRVIARDFFGNLAHSWVGIFDASPITSINCQYFVLFLFIFIEICRKILSFDVFVTLTLIWMGMVDCSLHRKTAENCLEIGSRYEVNNVYWIKQFRSKQSDQSTLSAKIHFYKTRCAFSTSRMPLSLPLTRRSKRLVRFLSLSLSL